MSNFSKRMGKPSQISVRSFFKKNKKARVSFSDSYGSFGTVGVISIGRGMPIELELFKEKLETDGYELTIENPFSEYFRYNIYPQNTSVKTMESGSEFSFQKPIILYQTKDEMRVAFKAVAKDRKFSNNYTIRHIKVNDLNCMILRRKGEQTITLKTMDINENPDWDDALSLAGKIVKSKMIDTYISRQLKLL
jgi:hypothetical protein